MSDELEKARYWVWQKLMDMGGGKDQLDAIEIFIRTIAREEINAAIGLIVLKTNAMQSDIANQIEAGENE